jgi:hypothetical protein
MTAKVCVVVANNDDDLLYTGEVSVADSPFSFELKLSVPMEKYREALEGKKLHEFREVIQIELKKNESSLELSDEEWRIFYYLLMKPIVDLYNARQDAKRKGRIEKGGAISAAAGEILLKPEVCKILSHPKFGCTILDDSVSHVQLH